MEAAGAGEMSEDVERKGIGTPATRAAILEKLVATGLVERKKAREITTLLPTQAGSPLVAVLPEALQSPLLTADWEQRLGQVERGELSPEDFMEGIAAMVKELVNTYQPVPGADVLFPSDREAVGPCPRCGGAVVENKKGFFCENRECRFVLWKDSKFFTAKKKALTKAVAAACAPIMTAGFASCWTMALPASAPNPSPMPWCAAISKLPSCPPTWNCMGRSWTEWRQGRALGAVSPSCRPSGTPFSAQAAL